MNKANIHREYLNSADADWKGTAMTTATATYYSRKIDISYSDGYASLLVASSAGSLAIAYEVSYNGQDWYTPVDTDGNDLSVVYAALTVTAGAWISFGPIAAPYLRFKFTLTGANSTVTAQYMHKETT